MKTFLLTLLTSNILILSSFSQTPYWKWAKHAGGTSYDEAGALLMNNDSNLVVAGFFRGTGWFPTDTFTSSTFNGMFIAEYNRAGDMLWVKHVADAVGGIIPQFIFQDAANNYYVVGTFGDYSSGGSVTFFPSTSFTSYGNRDIFVAKFNATGTLLWAQAIQSSEEPNTTFVADMDTSGRLWIAGRMFARTVFTNPVNDTLYEDSKYHIFLSCYNSSGFLTANSKVITNNSATDPQGLEAGINDDIYIAGYYYNRQLFGIDPDTFSIPGPIYYQDIFLTKFSAGGIHSEWAVGSGGEFSADGVTSLNRTAEGELILTGNFTADGSINSTLGSPIPLTTTASSEVFIAKYDTLGIAHWAKNAGHSSGSAMVVNDVCIGPNNKIFITGNYNGSGTFGTGTDAIIIPYVNDLFVAKYDAGGTVEWAQRGGGVVDENSYGITTDNYEYAYIAGHFNSAAVFDSTSTLDITVSSYGYTDILVGKVGTGDDGTVGEKEATIDNEQWTIYPNPANEQITIQSKANHNLSAVTLVNCLGQVVFQARNIEHQSLNINVSGFSAGVYLLRIQSGNEIAANKIIISR